jgi:pimeloyl-ACP methyl ester carboxylesterase
MAAAQAVVEADGSRLLPRLIRYLSDRRDHEDRFTGAIEAHPSQLSIVWGDQDPIAVVDMAHRLAERRPGAGIEVLEGVGHYPMIEAPASFAAAVVRGLDRG